MSILDQFFKEDEQSDKLWSELEEMFDLASLIPDLESEWEEEPVNQAQFEAIKATLVSSIDGDTVWADSRSAANLVAFSNHGLRLIGQRRQYVGIEIPVWMSDDDQAEEPSFEATDEDGPAEDEEIDLSDIGVAYMSEQVPEDEAQPIAMPSPTMSAQALQNFVKEQGGRWLILPDEVTITYYPHVDQGTLIISPDFDMGDEIEPTGAAHGYSHAFWEDLTACLGINQIRVPAEPIESLES